MKFRALFYCFISCAMIDGRIYKTQEVLKASFNIIGEDCDTIFPFQPTYILED